MRQVWGHLTSDCDCAQGVSIPWEYMFGLGGVPETSGSRQVLFPTALISPQCLNFSVRLS